MSSLSGHISITYNVFSEQRCTINRSRFYQELPTIEKVIVWVKKRLTLWRVKERRGEMVVDRRGIRRVVRRGRAPRRGGRL